MILKTDGIILKTIKYGDTSRIITVFSRDYGKISLIAKGARGKKSKFGAALEPLSFSHLVYYHKNERELQLLSQADVTAQFPSVLDNERKLMAGFAFLEFLNAVTVAEDPHAELYDLMYVYLSQLNDKMTNGAAELIAFLVKLSDSLGFGLNFFQCAACGTKLDASFFVKERVQFEPLDGGFYCTNCSRDGFHRNVHGQTLQALQTSDSGTPPSGDAYTQRTFNEALELLTHHLETHIDGMRKIRTLALIHPFD